MPRAVRHAVESSSGLAGLFSKIHDVSGFTVGVLNCLYHGWSLNRMFLCDQTSIKTPDPEIQTASLSRDTDHMPLWSAAREKACSTWPWWGRTQKPMPDLSGLCLICIFSSCFCSVSSAVTNPSQQYNLLGRPSVTSTEFSGW